MLIDENCTDARALGQGADSRYDSSLSTSLALAPDLVILTKEIVPPPWQDIPRNAAGEVHSTNTDCVVCRGGYSLPAEG